jgi:hypothetical protein
MLLDVSGDQAGHSMRLLLPPPTRLYLDAFHTQHQLYKHNRRVQTAVIENLNCKNLFSPISFYKNYNYLAIQEFLINIIRYIIITQNYGLWNPEGVRDVL